MIKGILFDFNGTLFYDSDKHIAAFQKFFEKRGLPIPTAEDIARDTFGRTNMDIFRDYMPNATEEELRAYGAEKEADYREVCLASPETFKLSNGVTDMFDLLCEKDIPFNIATGSPIDNLEFYYENFRLDKWIAKEKIVYHDNSLPGKPAPDFYIEAARRIGLSPSECIVFEDGKSGFISAKSAGAPVIYALVPSDAGLLDTAGVPIEREIPDFCDYESILRRHGLI